MQRQIAVAILTLAVCAGIVLLLPGPVSHIEAQQPGQIEKACPGGASPLWFGNTVNQATGKFRQSVCVDANGNITVNADTLQQAGSSPAFPPINLATQVTGTLPGANMAAVNLAGAGNGGVTGSLPFASLSGTATTAQIGTGTPAASKYVDGATGAWTALPANAGESVLSWGAASQALPTTACTENSAGIAQCLETFLTNSHTLTRLTYTLYIAAGGCTTNAVIGLQDVTASTTVSSLTVTTVAGFKDSGALSVAMTAGHKYGLWVIVAASGCTTTPSVGGLTAVFQ